MNWRGWPQSTKVLALALAAGVAAAASAMVPSPLSYISLSAGEAPEIRAPSIPKVRDPGALTVYASIAERPLFNADRKPDPLPPPPPPPVPPKPQIVLGDLGQLKLVGVILSGDNKIALVRRASAGTLTLRVGDTLDGWKIEKIDVQGVGLSGGDRQDSLRIPKAENRAVPNVHAQGE
jgi:hypothetical protein